MLETIRNVRIINIGHRISVHKEFIKSRKYHSIFYKDQGRTLYKFNDKEVYLETDGVIYLPQGASYYYENCGELEGKIFFATFDSAVKISDEPQLISLKNHSEIRKLFVKMSRAFRFGGQTGKLDAYSYFYKLLSKLEQSMEKTENESPEEERIASAVRYLQEHLFDTDLRISNLHELCKISAPTFRKIFEEVYGCTPKKYVLQQRIQSAAELLRSGECSNIAEVAAAVGFDDQLYFSKCFKQFYGVPPSSYKFI